MLIIVGDCRVEYSGRAKSTLGWGERLIVVKADGSVLVHRNEKREPVNWQPPGTKTEYEAREDEFIVYSYRTSPPERMNIYFRDVELISAHSLRDNAELSIVGMERDLVDAIEEDPSVIEEGLRITDRERQTSSGSIDLFCVDQDGTPVVVEVKRGQPSPNAAYQLEAYIADFKRKNEYARVRGILCAPRVPEMIRNILEEKGLEWREVEVEFELADRHQQSLDDYSRQ